jgi:hypothetical protein
VGTIAKVTITVIPNEFVGSKQPLTKSQEQVVAHLFMATMGRGNWAKGRLADIIKQEMRFTSRHEGGTTMEDIETLLDGISLTFTLLDERIPHESTIRPSQD